MRHYRPLLDRGFFNVVADERFQLAFRFSRECSGKNQDVSECVRFSINGGGRWSTIAPYLDCIEHDERAKSVPWETTYSRRIPWRAPTSWSETARLLHR
jgi:hypothetical protein